MTNLLDTLLYIIIPAVIFAAIGYSFWLFLSRAISGKPLVNKNLQPALVGLIAFLSCVGVYVVGAIAWDTFVNESGQNEDTRVEVLLDAHAADASTTTYKYKNITFQVFGQYDSSTLNVFQDDKLVLTKEGGGYSVPDVPCPHEDASTTNCDTSSSATFGVDINGDGTKNFVLEETWGGNGGYVDYGIFELTQDGLIEELIHLEGLKGGAVFKDLNSDGKIDIELFDSTFVFWHTDHASSPYVPVYLSWDNKTQTYIPDLILMHKPPPSQAEITGKVNFYKNTDGCTPFEGSGVSCSVPWSYALDLIYSGNAVAAIEYLSQVWPSIAEVHIDGGFVSVRDFKNQLLIRLKQSPYYRDIFILNEGKIF